MTEIFGPPQRRHVGWGSNGCGIPTQRVVHECAHGETAGVGYDPSTSSSLPSCYSEYWYDFYYDDDTELSTMSHRARLLISCCFGTSRHGEDTVLVVAEGSTWAPRWHPCRRVACVLCGEVTLSPHCRRIQPLGTKTKRMRRQPARRVPPFLLDYNFKVSLQLFVVQTKRCLFFFVFGFVN